MQTSIESNNINLNSVFSLGSAIPIKLSWMSVLYCRVQRSAI
jgi:hypothetical protein